MPWRNSIRWTTLRNSLGVRLFMATKAQRRKKKLQDRKKKTENFITRMERINREGEARAKRAIAWINEHGTSQLPKDFA